MVMEITNSGLDFAKKSNFRKLSQYNLYTIRIRLEKQKTEEKCIYMHNSYASYCITVYHIIVFLIMVQYIN